MVSGSPGRLQPIFGPIRRQFDAGLPCRGQIRHDIETILTLLSLISGSSSLHVSGEGSALGLANLLIMARQLYNRLSVKSLGSVARPGHVSLWRRPRNRAETWLGPAERAPGTFPAYFWTIPKSKSGPDEPLVRPVLQLSDFIVAGKL